MSNELVAELSVLLKNRDEFHDLTHALSVSEHAIKAAEEIKLPSKNRTIVFLAALLHDVSPGECQMLLSKYYPDMMSTVMFCISLVSYCDNGNSKYLPPHMHWMYIPRYADRLEIMGEKGIRRCKKYVMVHGGPMSTDETPIAKNREELKQIITNARSSTYYGYSLSVIDHFYDKLLNLRVHTGIKYIDDEMEKRNVLMEEFVFDYWK